MLGARPAGRVACLPLHDSTSFLSYRLLEPASSRAEQASHRHPGLVAQWEPGEHVAASTRAHQPTRTLPGNSGPQPRSHLSCPCAMGCRRLPSRHLPPWHRGWSGTGRALGTLYPPGSLGQGKSLVDAQKSNPLLSESIQRYVQASVWHSKFSNYCWSGNCLSKSSFWYQVCVTGLLVLSSWGVLACWCKLTLSARSFF